MFPKTILVDGTGTQVADKCVVSAEAVEQSEKATDVIHAIDEMVKVNDFIFIPVLREA